jgi:hypothetical protein
MTRSCRRKCSRRRKLTPHRFRPFPLLLNRRRGKDILTSTQNVSAVMHLIARFSLHVSNPPLPLQPLSCAASPSLRAATKRKVLFRITHKARCFCSPATEPFSGTKGRVAFSADALSQARLFYVPSSTGAFFAVSSVKAFNSDAADADVTGSHSMLLPCQHLYAPHCPAAS